MYVPITFAALAILTVAMIVVRMLWRRFPTWIQRCLVMFAIAMILLRVLSAATGVGGYRRIGWMPCINWAAVAGYELLILLFTLLPPRWLTTMCAAVLVIVPVFASSILMPLGNVFVRLPTGL